MTERRVREILYDRGFDVNDDEGYYYHYGQRAVVERRSSQDFRLCHKPKDVWLEHEVIFRNPIAAATYAVRHIIPKQTPYTGR